MIKGKYSVNIIDALDYEPFVGDPVVLFDGTYTDFGVPIGFGFVTDVVNGFVFVGDHLSSPFWMPVVEAKGKSVSRYCGCMY